MRTRYVWKKCWKDNAPCQTAKANPCAPDVAHWAELYKLWGVTEQHLADTVMMVEPHQCVCPPKVCHGQYQSCAPESEHAVCRIKNLHKGLIGSGGWSPSTCIDDVRHLVHVLRVLEWVDPAVRPLRIEAIALRHIHLLQRAVI